MKKLTIIALLLTGAALNAGAWGPEGHGTICAIAERNVKPSTRKAVERYLGRGMAYDMAKPGDELFKEFYNPAWDIVQSQMILGGYRLAAILDEIFK